MARPKGSKNKLKDETSSSSSAKKPHLRVVGGDEPHSVIGDNSDDQRALTMHHKGVYASALEKKKAADAALKNVCKTIKSELGDMGLADIKLLIQIDGAGDNSIVKQDIERLLRCAAWAGLPVGTQTSLFDEDRRTLAEKAADEGKYAGLNGKSAQSPHQPGSELDQEWMRAWHEGQAELRAIFVKNNETKVLRPAETMQRADDDDNDAALAAEADDGGEVLNEDGDGDSGEWDGEGNSFDRPGRLVNGIEIVGEEPGDLAPAPDIKWPDGDDCDVRPRFLKEAEEAGDL